jgi:choline dehydrogenase-like flavoprotein
VGTCRMGPSDDDVVDDRLRLRGVESLRIVDCSIMPTMISGNLNGPIMAIAWRAADTILDAQRYAQPSARRSTVTTLASNELSHRMAEHNRAVTLATQT